MKLDYRNPEVVKPISFHALACAAMATVAFLAAGALAFGILTRDEWGPYRLPGPLVTTSFGQCLWPKTLPRCVLGLVVAGVLLLFWGDPRFWKDMISKAVRLGPDGQPASPGLRWRRGWSIAAWLFWLTAIATASFGLLTARLNGTDRVLSASIAMPFAVLVAASMACCVIAAIGERVRARKVS